MIREASWQNERLRPNDAKKQCRPAIRKKTRLRGSRQSNLSVQSSAGWWTEVCQVLPRFRADFGFRSRIRILTGIRRPPAAIAGSIL